MCGLVGVFNKRIGGFDGEQRDVFQTLLLIDTLRGDDSTGAFVVHRNGDLSLAKEATTAGQFMRHKAFKDLAGTAFSEGACMIGHNRKATKGIIKDENAHPFVVDDQIVLVHNGGMWEDHKRHADVEVDSHAIAHLLHKNKSVEEALAEFHGAYALIWYDVEEEAVKIIRNKERPLWFMETDSSWIWASERAMLVFAAMRHGLKVTVAPTELAEFSLNTYRLENRRWVVTHKMVNFDKKPPEFEPDEQFKSWQQMLQDADEAEACDFKVDAKGVVHVPAVRENAIAANEGGGYHRPKSELNKDFFCTVGSNSYEKTSEFERSLAKTCNKITTLGEFNNDITKDYVWHKKVKCRAFEYVDDGADGYYLYASPEDDQLILFRHHFKAGKHVTEQRMMTMALNEYLMLLTVDKKAWSPLEGATMNTQHQEGYTVIISDAVQLLQAEHKEVV